jgi:hypothetical protein
VARVSEEYHHMIGRVLEVYVTTTESVGSVVSLYDLFGIMWDTNLDYGSIV